MVMRNLAFGILGLVVALACSSSDEGGNGGNAGSGGKGAAGNGGSPGGTGGLGGSNPGGAGTSGAGGSPEAGNGGQDEPDASVDGGDDASTNEDPDAEAGTPAGDPQTLAETGLYSDPAGEVLATNVMAYKPQFQLWSDGADKKRYIALPPGTQIDTSDMDHWKFPVGTKVWKEFTRNGTRVETRLLWKKSDDPDFGWFMAAYEWNAEQTEATLVPKKGRVDALGTPHNIPSTGDCKECHHGQPDRVLGFGAIQLSHDDSDVTLASLKADALLSDPPPVDAYTLPGTTEQRAALGLMHANCGHCHNPNGAGYDRNHMELLLLVGNLGSVAETSAYQTAVDVDLDQDLSMILPAEVTKRVVPGDPSKSALYLRMAERDANALVSMPPVGSEEVDTNGTQLIGSWITSLAP
jgi:hypothetical protein